jgi:hypothetical protein
MYASRNVFGDVSMSSPGKLYGTQEEVADILGKLQHVEVWLESVAAAYQQQRQHQQRPQAQQWVMDSERDAVQLQVRGGTMGGHEQGT